jgi:hypothetical protein
MIFEKRIWNYLREYWHLLLHCQYNRHPWR